MTPKDKIFVELTKQEAKDGCVKIISEGWLTYPLRLNVEAETKHNSQIKIINSVYQVPGCEEEFQQDLLVVFKIPEEEEEKSPYALSDEERNEEQLTKKKHWWQFWKKKKV